MEFEVGMDVLFCAQRQKEDEMLFDRWIHLLSDVSFDDFKNQIGYRPQRKEDDADGKEILDSVKKIMGG